jgi:hypothetical protein
MNNVAHVSGLAHDALIDVKLQNVRGTAKNVFSDGSACSQQQSQ